AFREVASIRRGEVAARLSLRKRQYQRAVRAWQSAVEMRRRLLLAAEVLRALFFRLLAGCSSLPSVRAVHAMHCAVVQSLSLRFLLNLQLLAERSHTSLAFDRAGLRWRQQRASRRGLRELWRAGARARSEKQHRELSCLLRLRSNFSRLLRAVCARCRAVLTASAAHHKQWLTMGDRALRLWREACRARALRVQTISVTARRKHSVLTCALQLWIRRGPSLAMMFGGRAALKTWLSLSSGGGGLARTALAPIECRAIAAGKHGRNAVDSFRGSPTQGLNDLRTSLCNGIGSFSVLRDCTLSDCGCVVQCDMRPRFIALEARLASSAPSVTYRTATEMALNSCTASAMAFIRGRQTMCLRTSLPRRSFAQAAKSRERSLALALLGPPSFQPPYDARAEGKLASLRPSCSPNGSCLDEISFSSAMGYEAIRGAALVLRSANRHLCHLVLRAWKYHTSSASEGCKADAFVAQVKCGLMRDSVRHWRRHARILGYTNRLAFAAGTHRRTSTMRKWRRRAIVTSSLAADTHAARFFSLRVALARAVQGAIACYARAESTLHLRVCADMAAACRAAREKRDVLRLWRTLATLQSALAPHMGAEIRQRVGRRQRFAALEAWRRMRKDAIWLADADAKGAHIHLTHALRALLNRLAMIAARVLQAQLARDFLFGRRVQASWRALREAGSISIAELSRRRLIEARCRRRQLGGAMRTLLRNAVSKITDVRLRTLPAVAHWRTQSVACALRRLANSVLKQRQRELTQRIERRFRLHRTTERWRKRHVIQARALGSFVVARQRWHHVACTNALALLQVAGQRCASRSRHSQRRLQLIAQHAAQTETAHLLVADNLGFPPPAALPVQSDHTAGASIESQATNKPALPLGALRPAESRGSQSEIVSSGSKAIKSRDEGVPNFGSGTCATSIPATHPSPSIASVQLAALPPPHRCQSPPRPASRAPTSRSRAQWDGEGPRFSRSLLRKLARSADSPRPRGSRMRQEPTRSSAPTYQAVVYTSLDGTPSQPLSRDVLSPSLRNAVKQGVTHTMRPRISRELSAEQRRGDAAAPHRLVLPEDALTNLSAPAAPSRLSAEELTTFTGAELPAAWGVTNSDLSTRHKHQWQQEDAQRRKLLGNGWDKVSRHSAGNEVRPFTSQPSKHLSVPAMLRKSRPLLTRNLLCGPSQMQAARKTRHLPLLQLQQGWPHNSKMQKA
ncbi:MAG: hypothetical protein SGPRY_003680, partial [Prymnesium sp.]